MAAAGLFSPYKKAQASGWHRFAAKYMRAPRVALIARFGHEAPQGRLLVEGDNHAERAEPDRQHRADNGREAEGQADHCRFKLFGGHNIALPSLMASTKAPAGQICPS